MKNLILFCLLVLLTSCATDEQCTEKEVYIDGQELKFKTLAEVRTYSSGVTKILYTDSLGNQHDIRTQETVRVISYCD